jgi:putative ABC transport system permease protein
MLLQDIRYAARGLWRTRGVAAVGMASLALGIGLNTTIFSLIDGIMLKPFPYEDPDRIVVIETWSERDQAGASLPDLRDWKAASSSLSTIAGVSQGSMTLTGDGEPERHQGAWVSWDLFRLLGIRPAMGRDFVDSDDRPNAAGVVLLSHMLWTTRYQSDPGIVGRRVTVNSLPYEVVGVMPPGFAFPENQRLWVPLAARTNLEVRDSRFLFTFGRIKPGATQEQAGGELKAIGARLARDYPATNKGWGPRIRTLRETFIPDDVTLVLGLMMAGVTLVLFIACSNVANLLLARAAARRRELAVRVALGAGRWRIIRQLLTEGLVLSLASVPFGLMLAVGLTRLIFAQIPPGDIPYYITWNVDARSMIYSIAIAVSTALLFGLVPALQTTRREMQESLKDGARGNSGSRARVRNALVVSQVALALVSLVGALLFVRSFRNLDAYELGFDTESALTLRLFMIGEPYLPAGAKERRIADIVQRVEALPGVEAAFAASNMVPIDGGGLGGAIEIDGRPSDPEQRPGASVIGVTPHFLATLGRKVRRGRDFGGGDANQAVAILNESMARRFWPNDDPIGRRFRLWTADGSRPWFTVVGIAPNMELFGIDPSNSQPPAVAFTPYVYGEWANTGMTIRTTGDPAAQAGAVRAAIRQSDSGLPVFEMRTLDEVRRLEFWEFGLYGWIFGTIGVMGVVLAAVGVYGVLAYSVSQRTQEIGVRLALGADRSSVFRLVVGQGLRLTGVGVVIGLILAAFGTPLARSLLFNVSPFDPVSFAAVSILLLAVALMASYVPARRATSVAPGAALRQD